MEINYNLISLFDVTALVQSLLLGTILIVSNKKNRPTLLLGCFLISYSAELVPSIVHDMGIVNDRFYLRFLPLQFAFLTPVLLFLYAKNLTEAFSIKKNWLYFVPGVIEFLFLLFATSKKSILDSPYFQVFLSIYAICTLLYMVVWAYLTYRLISKHQKKVLNYYSNTEKRLLNWVKILAMCLIVFALSILLALVLPETILENYAYPAISAINVIFIFWVALSGFQQSQVIISDYREENKSMNLNHSDNLLKEQLTKQKEEELFHQLLQLMEEKEPFKNSDLTLPILAQEMNITRKGLSTLINSKAEINFNQFINKYRIAAAQNMLRNANFDHLNMVGIAHEVGFNSKATFFSAFKKFVGVSPGVYKKRIHNVHSF